MSQPGMPWPRMLLPLSAPSLLNIPEMRGHHHVIGARFVRTYLLGLVSTDFLLLLVRDLAHLAQSVPCGRKCVLQLQYFHL